MASSAQYASVPLSPGVIASVANPNRDGTGTLVTLVSPQATGARIDDINIIALGSTTSGMLRFFLKRGTSYYPLREVPVSAVTPSATVAAFSAQLPNLAWILDSTSEIVVSTEKAESFSITVTRGGAL